MYKDEGAGRHGRKKVKGEGPRGMYKDEGTGKEKEARRNKMGNKRVKVEVGGKMQDLYCDTGSNVTIITCWARMTIWT